MRNMVLNSVTKTLLAVIEEAKNAELCRNVRASQEILRTVWKDFSVDPDFDYCEPAVKAELLRLCGVFLSFYGSARNEKNFQTRGKDLLTKSIVIFESEKLLDKAAEANVMLALCYWNGGEVEECEAILETIETGFADNQLHPVYLQICVNRMMTLYYRENFQEAIVIVEQLSVPMEFCKDDRLQAMFHNQAGILYRSIGEYDKGAFHLNEAIRHARRANNPLFVAINFNNLAFLYKEISNFRQAHFCISESIKGFTELDHKGVLPHVFDTKAGIFLDSGEPQQALEIIEETIDIFRQGEDYRGLTDALWTKCRCLFRLDRKTEALMIYTELQQIAAGRIGKSGSGKFEKALAEEIYVAKNLPLLDEVAAFKKSLVRAALIKFGNNLVAVGKYLKIKNHQTLSHILNHQFPELYKELGIRRRRRPNQPDEDGNEPKPATGNRFETKNKKPYGGREISRLVMQNARFTFDFNLRFDTLETYYFGKNLMKRFGVKTDAVVAVVPIGKLEKKLTILVSQNESYLVGKIEFDEYTRLFYVFDENQNPLPIDKSNAVGIPVGYCLFTAAGGDVVKFSRLKNTKE